MDENLNESDYINHSNRKKNYDNSFIILLLYWESKTNALNEKKNDKLNHSTYMFYTCAANEKKKKRNDMKLGVFLLEMENSINLI